MTSTSYTQINVIIYATTPLTIVYVMYHWSQKETFGKYSMDSIASCAFGVDAESFGAKESKFVKSAKDIFR